MTKVDLRFRLTRPLDQRLMESIARAHGVYGMLRVSVEASMDAVAVQYDASRLTRADVEAVLHRAGLPVMEDAHHEGA